MINVVTHVSKSNLRGISLAQMLLIHITNRNKKTTQVNVGMISSPCVHARTGPVLGRCCQHWPRTGPVLAHNGMFTGLMLLATDKYHSDIDVSKFAIWILLIIIDMPTDHSAHNTKALIHYSLALLTSH